ncbi:MAG: hypothetical protein MUC99_06655 [Anaerolineae bacterium]|nr:hypothetical protein [Anaerolineae bacterium]
MAVGQRHGLQQAYAMLEPFLKGAVERADAAEHDPTDALRGLVIAPEEIARHFENGALSGLWAGTSPHFDHLPELMPHLAGHPLAELFGAFDLPLIDQYIFLIALAPDLDRRYERLYGYLQDDVSQRYPTVNLMMNLLSSEVAGRYAVWERLTPEAPLIHAHLLDIQTDPARPNATHISRILRVDRRVLAYVMGGETTDERIARAVSPITQTLPILPETDLDGVRAALPESPLVYFRGTSEWGQRDAAAALCAEAGLTLLRVDLEEFTTLNVSPVTAVRLLVREGVLRGAALYLEPWDALLHADHLPMLTALWAALLRYRWPVFLCGTEDWEPSDLDRTRPARRAIGSRPRPVSRGGTHPRRPVRRSAGTRRPQARPVGAAHRAQGVVGGADFAARPVGAAQRAGRADAPPPPRR